MCSVPFPKTLIAFRPLPSHLNDVLEYLKVWLLVFRVNWAVVVETFCSKTSF